MVIIKNKGCCVTFIKFKDDYSCLNGVIFVFIIYLQRVSSLFTAKSHTLENT